MWAPLAAADFWFRADTALPEVTAMVDELNELGPPCRRRPTGSSAALSAAAMPRVASWRCGS